MKLLTKVANVLNICGLNEDVISIKYIRNVMVNSAVLIEVGTRAKMQEINGALTTFLTGDMENGGNSIEVDNLTVNVNNFTVRVLKKGDAILIKQPVEWAKPEVEKDIKEILNTRKY